jgi:mono/diheme cytochrome c family protein
MSRPVLCVALVMAACTAGLPHPTSAHLSVAQQSEPQVSLGDLERGRSLYLAKCGSCHALRDPKSVPAGQWQHEIDQMETKQGVHLTPAESHDIFRYLAAVSSAP